MFLFLLVVGLASYFWYERGSSAPVAGPPVVTDPWYAEIRATNNLGEGREVELALFARALNEKDCLTGTQAGWANISRACPSCTSQPPKCVKELPPRYSRLFDDAPIPSAYLSGTAANPHERDIRVVVYGLTDAEGVTVCGMMQKELEKNFAGPTHCVEPSN
jgi:hypothetical protein